MLPLMSQPAGGAAPAPPAALATAAAGVAGEAGAGTAATAAAAAAAVADPGAALLLPPRGLSMRHCCGSSKVPDQMPRLASRAASSRGTYALLYCLRGEAVRLNDSQMRAGMDGRIRASVQPRAELAGSRQRP